MTRIHGIDLSVTRKSLLECLLNWSLGKPSIVEDIVYEKGHRRSPILFHPCQNLICPFNENIDVVGQWICMNERPTVNPGVEDSPQRVSREEREAHMSPASWPLGSDASRNVCSSVPAWFASHWWECGRMQPAWCYLPYKSPGMGHRILKTEDIKRG